MAFAPAGDAKRHCGGWTNCSNRIHVVDADLKSYLRVKPGGMLLTIPKDRLLALVASKEPAPAKAGVADRRILSLVQAFLEQGVLDGTEEWVPERGTPQGAVISPLLSNIYLDPLDHLMAEKGYEMVRYADDFVVFCETEEDAVEVKERVLPSWPVSYTHLTLPTIYSV